MSTAENQPPILPANAETSDIPPSGHEEDPYSEDFGDLGALIEQCGLATADAVGEEPVNPADILGSLRAVNATVDAVNDATGEMEKVTLDSIAQESPFETPGHLIDPDEHGPMEPDHVRQLAGALLIRSRLVDHGIANQLQDAEDRAAGRSPFKAVRRQVDSALRHADFDEDAREGVRLALSEIATNVRDNVTVEDDDVAGRLLVDLYNNPLTGENRVLVMSVNGSPSTLEGRVKKAAAVGGLGLSLIHDRSDTMGTYHISPKDYEEQSDGFDPLVVESLQQPSEDEVSEHDCAVQGLRTVWFTVSNQRRSVTAPEPTHTSPNPVNA